MVCKVKYLIAEKSSNSKRKNWASENQSSWSWVGSRYSTGRYSREDWGLLWCWYN